MDSLTIVEFSSALYSYEEQHSDQYALIDTDLAIGFSSNKSGPFSGGLLFSVPFLGSLSDLAYFVNAKWTRITLPKTIYNGVEELVGILIGYMSGPLCPETPEEQRNRQAECIIIHEVALIR